MPTGEERDVWAENNEVAWVRNHARGLGRHAPGAVGKELGREAPALLRAALFCFCCPRLRVLEQCRDLRFAGLLLGLETERLVSRRLRDGVTLPVGFGVMRPIIQFDDRNNLKAKAFADNEIRDLAIKPVPDRPAGFSRELSVNR